MAIVLLWVWVRAYFRNRNGKNEFVRGHYRSRMK